MSLLSIRIFFSRTDVRVFILCMSAGRILQFLSKSYIKRHSGIMDDFPKSNKEIFPRGGVTEEVIAGKAIVKAVLVFLADHGLTAGLFSGTGTGSLIISNIPLTAISTCINNSIPQNLAHLEKKKYSIIIDGEKIFLDQCDQNLKY